MIITDYQRKILGRYIPNINELIVKDDVQELLAAADVMISDYSSCIFDYLLAKKPAFIYATDIDEYEGEHNGKQSNYYRNI